LIKLAVLANNFWVIKKKILEDIIIKIIKQMKTSATVLALFLSVNAIHTKGSALTQT